MTTPARRPHDESALRRALVGGGSRWTDLAVLPETDSTNAEAAQRARDGAPEGLVVVAEHQRAGRGRLARPWVTPARSGVVVSVVLRPDAVAPQHWTWLPLLAGLAVDATVRDAGVRAGLKWPNDVLADGRKLCGILLERVESGSGPAAVVGIGLNVDLQRDELPVPTATSLALEGATELDRDALLCSLLAHLEALYGPWVEAGGDPRAVREAYRRRCVSIGAHVRIELPDGARVHGTAEDVDPHGRLVVDGTPFGAGDVTHVRATAGWVTPPA